MNTILESVRALQLEWGMRDNKEFKETGFTLDTTIVELEKHFTSKDKLETVLKARIDLAPDKEYCIKKIIEEFEKYYEHNYEYNHLDTKNWPVDYLAYQCIKRGLNAQLRHFVNQLCYKSEKNEFELHFLFEEMLKDIGEGVAVAYSLPKLREALKLHQEQESTFNDISEPNNQKLNWTGTAGEFGAIIDLLIEKGYIEKIPVKKNKAKIFYEHFNIKTQTGETITERYLIDCFGKDKYNFLPNEIKLPLSINYGKEQQTVRKQNGNLTENDD